MAALTVILVACTPQMHHWIQSLATPSALTSTLTSCCCCLQKLQHAWGTTTCHRSVDKFTCTLQIVFCFNWEAIKLMANIWCHVTKPSFILFGGAASWAYICSNWLYFAAWFKQALHSGNCHLQPHWVQMYQVKDRPGTLDQHTITCLYTVVCPVPSPQFPVPSPRVFGYMFSAFPQISHDLSNCLMQFLSVLSKLTW